MATPKFNLGDRVIYGLKGRCPLDLTDIELEPFECTIKYILWQKERDAYQYAVEVPEGVDVNRTLHNCLGHTAEGRGWWILENYLTLKDGKKKESKIRINILRRLLIAARTDTNIGMKKELK